MKTATTKNLNYVFLAIALFLLCLQLANAQNGVGINTVTPKSNFEVNGSFGQTVTTVTANTTLDSNQSLVVCNNGAVAITITLPNATICSGRIYTIKKGTSSTADVMVMGAQTIDGFSDYMLVNTSEAVTVFSNGTEWKTIGKSNEPFPMGEISYFSTVGTGTTLSAQSDGSTNMVLCSAVTALSTGAMDFDNGGSNNGRLRYIGDKTKHFHIACTISMIQNSTNHLFVFGVAKNGTVLPSSRVIQKLGSSGDTQSTALHVAISMSKNDYLELFIGDISGTGSVTMTQLIYSL